MNKYEVLGASRSASLQELKSKYQALALETHPDKKGSSSEELKSEVHVWLLAVFRDEVVFVKQQP